MPEIRLSKPLKYDHPKGTPVTLVDQYINNDTKERTWFVAPKIDGLYYNRAVKFFEKAIKLRKKVLSSRGPVNPKDHEQGEAFVNKDKVFNFFTEACSGIILLFAAVESLVNTLTERSPKHDYKKKGRVFKISIGKLKIEWEKEKNLSVNDLLFLGIEEKIKKVIPSLYEFDSPVNQEFWQDFKELKKLRDGFIHCRCDHAYGANKGVNSLYSQLFDFDFEKNINNVGKLITYLDNESKNSINKK